jgi:hypothetical protein
MLALTATDSATIHYEVTILGENHLSFTTLAVPGVTSFIDAKHV